MCTFPGRYSSSSSVETNFGHMCLVCGCLSVCVCVRVCVWACVCVCGRVCGLFSYFYSTCRLCLQCLARFCVADFPVLKEHSQHLLQRQVPHRLRRLNLRQQLSLLGVHNPICTRAELHWESEHYLSIWLLKRDIDCRARQALTFLAWCKAFLHRMQAYLREV